MVAHARCMSAMNLFAVQLDIAWEDKAANFRKVKALLESSATPMSGYALFEVGAGYLNAYDAVTQAVAGNSP